MKLRRLKRLHDAFSIHAARNPNVGFAAYCRFVSRMHTRAAKELRSAGRVDHDADLGASGRSLGDAIGGV